MLTAKNLTKTFNDFTAVDHLNLTVEQGAIFGFLGHNGAGKTTTISMLTTLLIPTSGSAAIGGYDIVKENLKVRRLLGYLPESVTLYEELSAEENLRFLGRLSGVEAVDKRIDEVLEILHFRQWKHARINTFSKGMRQRIGIAQTLLHKPKILFLDEPTSGLDPQGTREMRDLLKRLNREWGTTIFMNTHLLSEATKLCTHIGIISHGRLLMVDSMESIREKFLNEKSLEEIYFQIEEANGHVPNSYHCP